MDKGLCFFQFLNGIFFDSDRTWFIGLWLCMGASQFCKVHLKLIPQDIRAQTGDFVTNCARYILRKQFDGTLQNWDATAGS